MKTLIVIGGGVAGLQAGVFTAKAGEETLVLDTGESLVHNTSNIQNLIGHDSIGGNELLNKAKDKLEQFGGELTQEKVISLTQREEKGFDVETEDQSYEAEYVVVASAGELDYLNDLDVEYVDGVEGPYMMDKHLKTDETNKVEGFENLHAAGLANTWEYQTSVAIGDGAKAAVNILSDKYEEPYEDHDT